MCRFEKREDPFVILETGEGTFALAVETQKMKKPLLLDEGLNRISFTDAEKQALYRARDCLKVAKHTQMR